MRRSQLAVRQGPRRTSSGAAHPQPALQHAARPPSQTRAAEPGGPLDYYLLGNWSRTGPVGPRLIRARGGMRGGPWRASIHRNHAIAAPDWPRGHFSLMALQLDEQDRP